RRCGGGGPGAVEDADGQPAALARKTLEQGPARRIEPMRVFDDERGAAWPRRLSEQRQQRFPDIFGSRGPRERPRLIGVRQRQSQRIAEKWCAIAVAHQLLGDLAKSLLVVDACARAT